MIPSLGVTRSRNINLRGDNMIKPNWVIQLVAEETLRTILATQYWQWFTPALSNTGGTSELQFKKDQLKSEAAEAVISWLLVSWGKLQKQGSLHFPLYTSPCFCFTSPIPEGNVCLFIGSMLYYVHQLAGDGFKNIKGVLRYFIPTKLFLKEKEATKAEMSYL